MKPLVHGLLALLAATALMVESCTIIPWGIAKAKTTRKVEAKYKVPKGKKILALVESSLVATDQPVAMMLTEGVNRRLVAKKVAAKTVSYRALLDMAAVTPGFSNMTPAEIGKKLGADIVCYVLVHEFALKDPGLGDLWRGKAQVTVSMEDVATGRRLWPIGAREGYWVKPVRTPPTAEASPEYATELSRTLCNGMSDNIAKLFYDHNIPIDAREGSLDQDIWTVE